MTPAPPTPSEISALSSCAAVFLPDDPPRASKVAFWRQDGSVPAGTDGEQAGLTVIEPDADGSVATRRVRAVFLPVSAALPVLTRARAGAGHQAAAFWGAATVLALQLAARGRLLPGLSPDGHDAWRLGPLEAVDTERLRELAEAMPSTAHAAPLPDTDGEEPMLPKPGWLLRAFLDAVADGLPRSPAATLLAGGSAFAADPPHRLPKHRAWAEGVAAGHDAGVRLSLRIEVSGLSEAGSSTGHFLAVLQLHSLTDPTVVADAAQWWAGTAPALGSLGRRARNDVLLTLRRAAAAWEPLAPLLSAAVPNAVALTDEEISELLSGPASRALWAAGLQVHWPRQFARTLTARAVVGADEGEETSGPVRRPEAGGPALLSPDSLLNFSWRFSVGDAELSRSELDQLAKAGRPLVRLRDQWVLLDPDTVRRARDRLDRKVTIVDALGSALAGSTEEAGERIAVRATGALEKLRERLADPEGPDTESVPQPPELTVELRDYQLRGMRWLHRMTSLGLGGCLADDMGLGKTITLIALHLHRQRDPSMAGPTLVVCPASLLGNWHREIDRFAPGTPVRRYHGSTRDLTGLTDGSFVLTTYGTMRLDAKRLAGTGWGLVVADEAQYIKNPFSATAKQLRTLPAQARVALTGTPVENNLSELWALLDWTTPGLLGRLGAFRSRYADAVEGGTDPEAAGRLARLVRPFLLRRRKSDPGIAPELPPKTETDRAVALTPEQAGLYEAVVREGLAEISGTGGLARRGLVLKLLTSLKQICNHPAQFSKEESPTLAGRSGKLELFDELLATLVPAGAGILVFTQYVQMARLLERHLAAGGVPSQLLHGGTPVARREEMVRRFQEGGPPVFLLSLKAAGTGLNLTRAEHVIHFDRWWNPAVEAQATDRAYRIGQDRPVQVHRLITEGTVEDRIAEMLRRKQALADAVLGSGEAALTELGDAELAELVELRRDEACTKR